MATVDLSELQESNARLRRQLADMGAAASRQIQRLKLRYEKCNLMASDLDRMLTEIAAQKARNTRLKRENMEMDEYLRELMKAIKAGQ